MKRISEKNKEINLKDKDLYKYAKVTKEHRCNKCKGIIIKKTVAIKWFGLKDELSYTHPYCMGKSKSLK